MSKINIDEIYSKHFRTVYKYLVYLTHDTELTEDLTQETFCKAIKSIETVTIDSKECYAIKSKHWDYFIDKETGLIIKDISYATDGVDSTRYYYYEFGTVKDSDIVKPDKTGYEENSNF